MTSFPPLLSLSHVHRNFFFAAGQQPLFIKVTSEALADGFSRRFPRANDLKIARHHWRNHHSDHIPSDLEEYFPL